MSNLNRDALSVVIPDQDMRDAKAKLSAIGQLFPFLIELSADEILQLPRINVANHNFVQDVIQVLESHPVPLPNGVSAAEMKKDLDLFDQLDNLAMDYEVMLKKIRNTVTLAGSEAYKSALFAYKIIQTYAESSVPGYGAIYERLKQRFAAQGMREVVSATTTTTNATSTNNTANSNATTTNNTANSNATTTTNTADNTNSNPR